MNQSREEPRSFWSYVREDYQTNARDWTQPGFRALLVYRFGAWQRTLNRSTRWRAFLRKVLGVLHYAAYSYVRNHYGIELPKTASVGRRVWIAHQGAIVIHGYATIGDDCLIRQAVTIGEAGRGVIREEAPRLEDDVQVGAGAMILGRVTIGTGARIGPNVVIYTDIPPHATVVPSSPRIIFAPRAQLHPRLRSTGTEEAEDS